MDLKQSWDSGHGILDLMPSIYRALTDASVVTFYLLSLNPAHLLRHLKKLKKIACLKISSPSFYYLARYIQLFFIHLLLFIICLRTVHSIFFNGNLTLEMPIIRSEFC